MAFKVENLVISFDGYNYTNEVEAICENYLKYKYFNGKTIVEIKNEIEPLLPKGLKNVVFYFNVENNFKNNLPIEDYVIMLF